MVIRGKPRGNGKQLASYLLSKGENDRVQVMDIRGTAQNDNLKASLLEMSLTSELSRTDKGLYHAQINPAIGEDKKMTSEDWFKAADILEKELKLEGQKRVIVLHEKKGRLHAHVVWERYDHDKGRMVSDSYSRYAQDRARLTIEKELEQRPTPKRNAQRDVMKEELTDLWYETETAEQFIQQANEKGYAIAISRERRPYRVVDEKGQDHDLLRQLDGVKVKEVREIFKDTKLPTKKQAMVAQRSKVGQRGFDYGQEKFADHIDRAKSKREVAIDKERLNKDTLAQMKQSGAKMKVSGAGRPNYLSDKQEAFLASKEQVQERERSKEEQKRLDKQQTMQLSGKDKTTPDLDSAQDRFAAKLDRFRQEERSRKRTEMKENSADQLSPSQTAEEKAYLERMEEIRRKKERDKNKGLDLD
jgi:hypothetical protein